MFDVGGQNPPIRAFSFKTFSNLKKSTLHQGDPDIYIFAMEAERCCLGVKVSVKILQVQHYSYVKFRHVSSGGTRQSVEKAGAGFSFFWFLIPAHRLGGKSIKALTEKTVFWAPHDTHRLIIQGTFGRFTSRS